MPDARFNVWFKQKYLVTPLLIQNVYLKIPPTWVGRLSCHARKSFFFSIEITSSNGIECNNYRICDQYAFLDTISFFRLNSSHICATFGVVDF